MSGSPDGFGSAALAAAKRHEDRIVGFLRDMIAIPAESCREGPRCERVKSEYESLGFDEVFFDGLGTVVARIGNGPFTILMDGHIDCVGVGNSDAWSHDPFLGKVVNRKVYGRGAVDELPSIACMAYGARMLADRGLPDDVTLYLTASVMEEDCDGYCMLHLIETEGIRPDVVVIGEPTDLNVYRGHRGRMEISVSTKGVSAHGAYPEKGVNAIYKMAPIVREIESLNDTLPSDEFLGKGTVTISRIESTSPSLNAVADSARIILDRRLTAGETAERAVEEIRALPSIGEADVRVLEYDATSWRGAQARQEKFFPSWVLPEDHFLVRGLVGAVSAVRETPPAVGRWTFSTNGVATMGRLGIPTAGFAPGLEELSHTTGEWVAVDDLITATAAYSLMPEMILARR